MHYFAHVPKCGGKSIEAYLTERFGELAMVDQHHERPPPGDRWSKSSPQHISLRYLERIFPADWFASSFAVVRNPVTRFASAYNYRVAILGTIPPGMNAEQWFAEYRALEGVSNFLFDNHLRPQDDLVPENARVFRLEDGLDGIVPYLDEITGDQSGPRRIEHLHETKDEMQDDVRSETLSARLLAELRSYYARDFERFGYGDTPQPVNLFVPGKNAYASKTPPSFRDRIRLPLSHDRWPVSRAVKRSIMRRTGIDLS